MNEPAPAPEEPELAIVDPHHHLWDPVVNYHPWLCDLLFCDNAVRRYALEAVSIPGQRSPS